MIRLSDQTGADAAAVAAAYAATRDAFDLSELYAAIDALDGSVPGALQLRLYGDLQDLLMSRMVWFIRHGALTHGSLGAVVGVYRQGIAEIERTLPDTLSAAAGEMWRKRTQDLVADGTPEDLAQRLAALKTWWARARHRARRPKNRASCGRGRQEPISRSKTCSGSA